MKPQDFINAVKDAAITADKQYGIPASLTIAQAILESGWGASGLASAYCNLFGIKATPSWTGKSVNLNTKEYRNGAYQDIKDWFRVYASWPDSIVDHTKVLLQDRYAPVRAAKDYKEACRQVQACGYATSPTYSENLIKLIEQNKLNQYDVQPQSTPVQEVAADVVYTVKPGDTLSGIAVKHGTTYQELAKINGIADPNKIYPGQKIKFKRSAPQTPAPQQHTTYVVQKGDSLWKIAHDYHTTVDNLARLNNIANPSLIYPGQKIIIR